MDQDRKERITSSPVFRIVRWTVPWVLFVVVVFVLAGTWNDFQAAQRAADAAAAAAAQSALATSTVSTNVTGTPVANTSAVTVTDGVHLRAAPSSNADVVATEGKSTALSVTAKTDGWFKVKDPAGHIGWVTDSNEFVRVVVAKKKK